MSPAFDVLAVLNEAVLMVRLDQQGNVQHINNKFKRLLGLTHAEIMGKPYSFRCHTATRSDRRLKLFHAFTNLRGQAAAGGFAATYPS
ncbi:PAS domain-containing protein [Oligoflexus sp.]|uniref:PAS domain-containing protein n=1 Tax=Oligoflexus sp. TaxID=1971216 RepID=UPI0039C8FAE5